MKKTFIALFAIAMIGGTIASCKKDKKTDCASLTTNLANATKAYAAEQSSANCKNYKAAIQDLINGGCVTSSDEKAAYQLILDNLNCDVQ
ncbi:hypothetical protein DC498_17440 [Terrimonas sp.]|uniref:hypothetical protein n=1 Tax=Terrimonas sp. TaxID=1914338 RepID=UPI000D513B52|nr:hypothetical protein [Terrimonas sp.]PVD50968.1 hypothetical protein DC498_17440 [Terrimonas sp.]